MRMRPFAGCGERNFGNTVQPLYNVSAVDGGLYRYREDIVIQS